MQLMLVSNAYNESLPSSNESEIEEETDSSNEEKYPELDVSKTITLHPDLLKAKEIYELLFSKDFPVVVVVV